MIHSMSLCQDFEGLSHRFGTYFVFPNPAWKAMVTCEVGALQGGIICYSGKPSYAGAYSKHG